MIVKLLAEHHLELIVKLLTEHHLEFLSLKEGCRGSSESTLVKMSNCWKSHAGAQILFIIGIIYSSPPPSSRRVLILYTIGLADFWGPTFGILIFWGVQKV